MSAGGKVTVELRPEVARALLAAEPFSRTDSDDWFEGRDALLKALSLGAPVEQGPPGATVLFGGRVPAGHPASVFEGTGGDR